jgi:hypothetical protein
MSPPFTLFVQKVRRHAPYGEDHSGPTGIPLGKALFGVRKTILQGMFDEAERFALA